MEKDWEGVMELVSCYRGTQLQSSEEACPFLHHPGNRVSLSKEESEIFFFFLTTCKGDREKVNNVWNP